MFPCLTMVIALHPENLLPVLTIPKPADCIQLGGGVLFSRLSLQPQTCPSPSSRMFAYLFHFKQLFVLFHIHTERVHQGKARDFPRGAQPEHSCPCPPADAVWPASLQKQQRRDDKGGQGRRCCMCVSAHICFMEN